MIILSAIVKNTSTDRTQKYLAYVSAMRQSFSYVLQHMNMRMFIYVLRTGQSVFTKYLLQTQMSAFFL